ncbi:hypothetical protein [Devosia riboflavina]
MASAGLVGTSRRIELSRFASQPLFWLSLALIVLVGLLALPVVVPIGPMYWDTYLYLDAAHRIASGQLPSVDFSMPVGPLGYYLFAWGLKLFPSAQPLLLAQWALLAVAAPLMAVVLWEVSSRDRALSLLLLVPFLIFAIAPSNAQFYHPLPGLDGFGIYNRHVVVLLYVLLSGLLFLRDGRKLAIFCAATMLALFLTKITGFLVGGLFGVTAVFAGRLRWTTVLLAAGIFLVPLLALELLTGMVSAYLRDISQLAGNNSSTLLPRFRTVVTNKLDVLLPAALLALVLLVVEWRDGRHRLFDSSFVWFSVAVVGGIIFETQNTGSQEFIFIWPVLALILVRMRNLKGNWKTAVLVLGAFAIVPTMTTIVSKSVRAAAAGVTYAQLDAPLLKNIGQVSARWDMIQRAELIEPHYVDFRPSYEDLADKEQLPNWQYFSDIDNQVQWVLSAEGLVETLLAFEVENNIRLAGLMTLDFTDPFPWILDRQPTPHLQIGADPTRTIGSLTPEIRAAIEATDGVLRTNCPVTWARRDIEATYAEALTGRTVVALNPCWDLLLRAGILPS